MADTRKLVVPDGTKLYCLEVKELHQRSKTMLFRGGIDDGETQILLNGFIPIDMSKPVYIMQLNDEGE